MMRTFKSAHDFTQFEAISLSSEGTFAVLSEIAGLAGTAAESSSSRPAPVQATVVRRRR